MKIFKHVAVTLAASAAFAAMSSVVYAQDKGVVGISLPDKTESRWITDGKSMVDALKAKGYSADLQYANYDVPTQVNQVENMLAKGVKALVIAPIDGKTFSDALALAQKKGIKIISYDRLISQTKDVDYYATFDNYGVGVLQGQSIVSAWQKAGSKTPFNIEIFGGSSDDNNAHMVYAGGMSVLKPYIDSGKFVIRSKQVSFEKVATRNWDGATAQARMDNLLSAFYGKDHLDAVWAPNDALAIGIISSLKGVGYGSGQQAMPVITGQDADVQNVKSIVRGEQTSTVFKDTRKLAGVTADMVDNALAGKQVTINDTKSYNNGAKIVPTYLVKPVLVDKSNYQSELVTSGYYTQAQIK
ncbi:multiple monosaccharide ABC transporter substrate-binding protein [Caballeronia sp. LZ043]|uniref:multiple monosaccharide ABC transporter substrate-binding protein n=1 Tax=Caballeronia sp. LZ043 TaxID=3038569 RepID=UPI002866ADCC|nr:multiple monosaccharide ABC transporter substrate-binding protein [Caballeronia sp. LZ043]MDR5823590.1 sugar ABC transporter substrate-binding protein [Caballeronia sp. LZ043]